ncbi:hypothetical protein [uncultured Methylobacterium sp.]|uniref:hypothetical protein n=1 Tax=uncultured Methylobacterium sp. TaxID=157278 RepID=UPI0025967730|nr:hypothetical protein [uncultured Methylobacterium sp.]
MSSKLPARPTVADPADVPMLGQEIRRRLGHHLQLLYEPDFETQLEGRIAELMLQLGQDRRNDEKSAVDPPEK